METNLSSNDEMKLQPNLLSSTSETSTLCSKTEEEDTTTTTTDVDYGYGDTTTDYEAEYNHASGHQTRKRKQQPEQDEESAVPPPRRRHRAVRRNSFLIRNKNKLAAMAEFLTMGAPPRSDRDMEAMEQHPEKELRRQSPPLLAQEKVSLPLEGTMRPTHEQQELLHCQVTSTASLSQTTNVLAAGTNPSSMRLTDLLRPRATSSGTLLHNSNNNLALPYRAQSLAPSNTFMVTPNHWKTNSASSIQSNHKKNGDHPALHDPVMADLAKLILSQGSAAAAASMVLEGGDTADTDKRHLEKRVPPAGAWLVSSRPERR